MIKVLVFYSDGKGPTSAKSLENKMQAAIDRVTDNGSREIEIISTTFGDEKVILIYKALGKGGK